MKTPMLCILFAALLAGVASPQGTSPLHAPPQGTDPNQEIQRLFQEVERSLREIDILLSDAAAGDTSLSEVPDSGLDKLLEVSQSRSRSVVEGIDRILELARQSQQQQSSSGGQGAPDSQESPLDQQRSQENRDREQTPETPQQPGESEQQEQQQSPDDGQRPSDDDRPTEDPGRNRPASEDEREGGARQSVDGSVEAWGELPTRVRQVFRTEGGQDLPVQYRDWIDAYYRKLNETRNR